MKCLIQSYPNNLLSEQLICNLEIIDAENNNHSGKELQDKKLMNTISGNQIVSLLPLRNTEQGFVLKIRNEKETRSESHRIITVVELMDILFKEFGLRTVLQHSHLCIECIRMEIICR